MKALNMYEQSLSFDDSITAYSGILKSLCMLRKYDKCIELGSPLLGRKDRTQEIYDCMFYSYYHQQLFNDMFNLLVEYLDEYHIILEDIRIPNLNFYDDLGEYYIAIRHDLIKYGETSEDCLERLNGPTQFIAFNIVIGFKLKFFLSNNQRLRFLLLVDKAIPNIPKVKKTIIAILYQEKNYEEALRYSSKLVKDFPEDRIILIGQGRILIR